MKIGILCLSWSAAWAASLGNSVRTLLSSEVQQILSMDYCTLKNSEAAMRMKQSVMPRNLKLSRVH